MQAYASQFLAKGSTHRECYLDHGVPPHKIFLTPLTVDNADFCEHASSEEEHAGFLKKQGLKPNVPVILFAGKMRAELPACYSVADVFVLPSEDEAWG